ncbi:MAG: ABC transporter substrate-binding protein, partial [Candidatus Bathyarchaeia archaeon]
MSKVALLAIVVVVVLGSVAGYLAYMYLQGQASPAIEKNEILLGGSFCLTGRLGKSGDDFLKAIRIGMSIINDEGGIYVKDLGRKLPLKLIYYDSQSDAVRASSDTERLILVDKVDFLLGAFGSILGTAISNVANKYGV